MATKRQSFESWCHENNRSLLSEWNYEKNVFGPDKIAPKTHKKVWWICNKGHEWEATVANRVYGNGCPYCSNKKALSGYNDLATINPEIAKEWHPTKNGDLTPDCVLPHSNKNVWWKCSKCGNEWETMVNSRAEGSGCPYCSKPAKAVRAGYNDLATINPDIAKEWHPTKNGNLTPNGVLSHSNKKVWWVCDKGHEWETTVSNRVRGRNCPLCNNEAKKKRFKHIIDNTELLSEWDYDKNYPLKPSEVALHSKTIVWWRCNKGHEWQDNPDRRANGKGCPFCKIDAVCVSGKLSKDYGVSFNEKAIAFYLKRNVAIKENYRPAFLLGGELDIFIEKYNLAVEYDGYEWHKMKKESDERKNHLCNKNGIKLIRIRENKLPSVEGCTYTVYPHKRKSIEDSIIFVLKQLKEKTNGTVNMDVDIERDNIAIQELFTKEIKTRSLSLNYPQIMDEWDYEKNGSLIPEMYAAHSGRKVWWICKKGHSYQMIINSRTGAGLGCPYCSGQRLLTGFNDLATTNPELMKEWDYDRNVEIGPTDISKGSRTKVWWICDKGHHYESSVYNRVNGKKCPFCSNNKVLKGFNDLESQYPDLMKEWDYEKNTGVKPNEITTGYQKKVWWICKKGHSWEAPVSIRTYKKTICPYCSGRNAIPGENDLETLFPKIAIEWDYEKNIGLKPSEIKPGSGKTIWWICSKNHSWKATAYSRTSLGTGCPLCYKEKRSNSRK